jgi:hypothetical protein
MKRAKMFFALVVILGGMARASAADLAPGAIFVHTARDGTTLTSTNKGGEGSGLMRGTVFAAHGQTLNAPAGLAVALVLSNGNALYLPNGGRLTFQEFTQEPVTDTGHDRSYEPTRSNLRLNLDQGTLVISGRTPVPTSTFTLTTPLAQINCHAQALAVKVDADSVTVTVLDGIAEITAQGSQTHDAVQAGQTVTISRQTLHDAYPLKFTTTTTDANDRYSVLVNSARRIESYTTFTGPPQHLQVALRIPTDTTMAISADDPRFL